MRWLTTPALALMLALTAFAEDTAPSAGPVDDFFARWDANKDGVVTTDECESTRLFSKNDRDSDGKITREEVAEAWKAEEGSESLTEPSTGGTQPGRANPKKGGVGLPDANPGKTRPGSLSDDQNRMRVRRIFNRFDKNGDDQLDAQEAAAYYFEVLDSDRDGALMQTELAANPKVGPEKAAMTLQHFDKDGDGAVFPSEWSLPEDGAFRRIDANGDGRVSFDEALIGFVLPGTGGGTVAQGGGRGGLKVDDILKQQDSDGDGRLSADEFKGPAQLFGRGDANGDGYLDRAELEDASRKLAKMAGSPSDAPGGEGGRDMAAMVKRADRDGDGRVTREEWPGRPQMFDRMDKNGDGVLDDSDFGRKAMGGTDSPPAQPPADGGSMEPADGGGEGSDK